MPPWHWHWYCTGTVLKLQLAFLIMKWLWLPGVDSVNFSLYYLSEQRVSCDIHSGKFDKTINAMSLQMNNRMWNVNGSCPICLISYHTYPLLYEELSILFHFYSLKRKGHNSGLFMRLQWSKYRFLLLIWCPIKIQWRNC